MSPLSLPRRVIAAGVLALAAATPGAAQDTTVAPKLPPVAKPAAAVPAAGARQPTLSRLSPPLSPRRAFLYSFVLPGFGQSRLDRGTSGALFASIELAAFAMVRRSAADLREVRRYRRDSLPLDYEVDGTGLKPVGTFPTRYGADLERARRLHVEDWLAVVAFNHLFAGADAFVAAQLWDVPVSLSAAPQRQGAVLIATIRW